MMGTLFVCATPIGNLEDMTIRAVNALKNADLIAAEDTRHTLKLLNYFDIKTPLTSYHEHNKKIKGAELVEKLKHGKNIALVSDAGTPAISDPGEDLVRLCIENDITVTPIPGCSAFVNALVCSGLPTAKFVFEGFLSKNKSERRHYLENLKFENRTMIFYAAPHDVKAVLADMLTAFGDRKICCARELTKKYEEFLRGSLEDVIKYFEQNDPKGEFVLTVEGSSDIAQKELPPMDVHIEKYIEQGFSEKEAIKLVAKERGVPKSVVYDFAHGIDRK